MSILKELVFTNRLNDKVILTLGKSLDQKLKKKQFATDQTLRSRRLSRKQSLTIKLLSTGQSMLDLSPSVTA